VSIIFLVKGDYSFTRTFPSHFVASCILISTKILFCLLINKFLLSKGKHAYCITFVNHQYSVDPCMRLPF